MESETPIDGAQIEVRAEIDRFRQKLLDLSNTNRLLNYRKTRTRTIQIIDELPNQIFDRLVTKEQAFSFLAKPETKNSKNQAIAAVETEAPTDVELPMEPEPGSKRKAHLSDDKLQTDLTEAKIDRVLTVIRQEANASIDETGVNYLYLVLGMLEWKEREGTTKVFKAPLILIPVQFTRSFDARSAKYVTEVTYTGDDIQPNLCLRKRLETDFGLVLPPYGVDENGTHLPPEEYFAQIRKAIAKQAEWKVSREALIGFFSFRKLLMYLDLAPETWQGANSLENHPLVRAVVEGGHSGETTAQFEKDYEIDHHPGAQSIALVKDADSSQHSALCDISSGRSLVIEGPPGTGKSQTITNAIANALHNRKSVLFVAEKLAALEVVQNNLTKAGLGDFCLTVHSDSATPKQVFASLRDRINRTFPTAMGIERMRSRLDARKAKLREYVDACAATVGPHQKPLYELFWAIVDLRSKGVSVLPNASLDTSLSEDTFDEHIASLKEISSTASEFGSPETNVWQGFFANRLGATGSREVERILGALLENAKSIDGTVTDLQADFGELRQRWLGLAVTLPDQSALSPPQVLESTLLPFLSDQGKCKCMIDLCTAVKEANAAVSLAHQKTVGDSQAAIAAAQQLCDLATHFPKYLSGRSLGSLRETLLRLKAASKSLAELESLAKSLLSYGFDKVSTLRDFDLACTKYRLISHAAVTPPKAITAAHYSVGAPAAWKRGAKKSAELEELKNRIAGSIHLDQAPDDVAIAVIRDTLQAYGSSWTRIFRISYWQERAKLLRFAVPAARAKTNTFWIQLLDDLTQLRSETENFVKDDELRRYFGDDFQGIRTSWKDLETTLLWVKKARTEGLDFDEASLLLRRRWSDAAAPAASQVLTAGTCAKGELGQDVVSQSIGLTPEAVVATPLSQLQAQLEQLQRQILRVESLRGHFLLDDQAAVSKLFEAAKGLIRAMQLAHATGQSTHFKAAFPQHFNGLSTETQPLETTAHWVHTLLNIEIPHPTITAIAEGGERSTRVRERIQLLRKALSDWNSHRETLGQFGTLATGWLVSGSQAASLQNDVERVQASLAHLPPWAGFCRAVERCRASGLEQFATAVYDGTLAIDDAVDCYLLTLFESIAEESLEDPSLSTFSRHAIENTRTEFRDLDKSLLTLNREEIANRASDLDVPQGVSKGRVRELTEFGLIRNEIGKQQRHCRIRDLIDRAGRAVQGLKPCFMMSPLSIAQYLPAGSIQFDLVIMDEASQIKPEDALGTLIRAKQIVVVGDPKQLPPTSFFDRMSEADDEHDEEEATFLDDTESILEVAMRAFPHRRRLRWHYRSQHESLIAFSNEKFYDSDLVVFPSPTRAAGRLGLHFHHIPDASFTGGCNPIEAEAVAQAVVKHAIQFPDETLGVATFNAKQAQAIRDRLDEICSSSSEARVAIERKQEHADQLFVKNLENVQGDERDVIFISCTYGPDPATRVVMNRFGPMTQENGWRRLNVLVTRAKRRVEVFSSMMPVDIKGGPDKSRGVNAMKDYLHYAMTGQLVDRGSLTGRDPDSPFEISVARIVEGIGLKVVPQVGVAGYFVDLGVRHPDHPGEYLLGIECDGATYHSSKSARDRDRLREEVITARGWHLHRIWSTDWFLNQDAEAERLRQAIKTRLNRVPMPSAPPL